ncbi:flavin-dependent dehydrogenase [Oxalobacteraceae bacterium GrIS 1.11]
MPPVAPIEADVVVLGAGPAGCALALNLAPYKRVLLLDKGRPASRRVGESLPAAAGRLLRDMNLERAFLEQGHARCHVTHFCWGTHDVAEQDALRNLDGPGWHLDRDRFDTWLAAVAVERGSAMLAQTRLLGLQRALDPEKGWLLDVERMGKPLRVSARLLIDASGRDGALGRHVGGERRARGKLVCGWVFGRDTGAATGVSELHAEEQGWWYTASLPGERRLLAFYTDADLPAARSAHTSQALLMRLEAVPHLRSCLAEARFEPASEDGFCAAHGVVLERPWGADWLAIGDAALAFDPLSSQGLFNALYTGLAGAEAAYRHLQGDAGALADYGSEIGRIERAYRQHVDAWYRIERRWPESEFWKRRHGTVAPP